MASKGARDAFPGIMDTRNEIEAVRIPEMEKV
jgi:hypothetical protein